MRPTGLGLGDVLTLEEACAALRVRESVARAWLRDRGLVVHVAGRDLVVWADVLDALRRGPPEATATRPARVRGTPLPYEEV